MFDSWIYWAASAACEKSCMWIIICVSEANRRPALDCVNSLRIDLLIRWSISVLLYCTCSIYQPDRSVTSVLPTRPAALLCFSDPSEDLAALRSWDTCSKRFIWIRTIWKSQVLRSRIWKTILFSCRFFKAKLHWITLIQIHFSGFQICSALLNSRNPPPPALHILHVSL